MPIQVGGPRAQTPARHYRHHTGPQLRPALQTLGPIAGSLQGYSAGPYRNRCARVGPPPGSPWITLLRQFDAGGPVYAAGPTRTTHPNITGHFALSASSPFRLTQVITIVGNISSGTGRACPCFRQSGNHQARLQPCSIYFGNGTITCNCHRYQPDELTFRSFWLPLLLDLRFFRA